MVFAAKLSSVETQFQNSVEHACIFFSMTTEMITTITD